MGSSLAIGVTRTTLCILIACSSPPRPERSDGGFSGSLTAVQTPYGRYRLRRQGGIVQHIAAPAPPLCGGAIPRYLDAFRSVAIDFTPDGVRVNGVEWRVVSTGTRSTSAKWIAKYGSPGEVVASPLEVTHGAVTTLMFRGDANRGAFGRVTYMHTDSATDEILCASAIDLEGQR
jgi:hypothetical protein